ncbi:hypothetical protein [Microbacterium sp.]|uniref:hypothetical protein n=1 Tax=Microbacterium sp. TaxID=51671 RepID=UPI003F9B6803
MGTSFEQFNAVLRNDVARRAVGLDISNSEAERIAGDPVLARAYYDNWRSRSNAGVMPIPLAAPPAHPEPFSPPTVARSAALDSRITSDPSPHTIRVSVTGMVLAILGYFLTSTWFSLLGLVGLGISIYAIVAARAAKPRSGWKAGLTMGIIGTVAGGAALILLFAWLSGYYN